MSAKDLGTGKEQKITITSNTNLSEDEIDKAVKEAEAFASEDKKRKEKIDAKNDADSFVFQCEKFLNESGDKIETEDKDKVQEELSVVKALLEKANIDSMSDDEVQELKKATEKLTEVFYAASTKLYQQQSPEPEQSEPQEQSPQDGDDVVDGDYREV